eukprot:1327934-Amphidinium_carterae.1
MLRQEALSLESELDTMLGHGAPAGASCNGADGAACTSALVENQGLPSGLRVGARATRISPEDAWEVEEVCTHTVPMQNATRYSSMQDSWRTRRGDALRCQKASTLRIIDVLVHDHGSTQES